MEAELASAKRALAGAQGDQTRQGVIMVRFGDRGDESIHTNAQASMDRNMRLADMAGSRLAKDTL